MKIEADMLLNIIYYTIVDDYTPCIACMSSSSSDQKKQMQGSSSAFFCSSFRERELRALLIFRSPGLIHELVVGASAMENVYKVYFIQNQCLKIMFF